MTIIICLFVGGCSRTVTTMPVLGTQMAVDITLRGTADVTNNKYFVILSTMEAYQIPLPPPYSLDEFLEPGDTPQPGTQTLDYYYSTYYSTWAGYIVVDSQGYSFEKGPFVYNVINSKQSIAGLGNVTNKLSFVIDLTRIFGSNLPKTIYYDVVSVSYPSNALKILKDRISPPTFSFEPLQGTVIQKTDIDSTTVIDPSTDIISWTINIL